MPAVLVVAALAGACGDRPPVRAGAVLIVDGDDFRGATGDGALSLTEAIEVAGGTLDPAALDAAERARISGRPGRGRHDGVRFAPGLVVRLRRVDAPVDAILPPLTDPGDAIDGAGAVLDAGPRQHLAGGTYRHGDRCRAGHRNRGRDARQVASDGAPADSTSGNVVRDVTCP
jgi:hypothetical protein